MKKKQKPLVWYVKWIATVSVLVSVSFRYAGVEYHVLDLAFGSAGAVMWLWVSILWNDRALIILNTVMFIMLFGGLLKNLF
jgi:hypothetical protein|tara:strand:- start:2197 stop:2439 length:243 start_codon:yes stop_codon:yes gene_type:complete